MESLGENRGVSGPIVGMRRPRSIRCRSVVKRIARRVGSGVVPNLTGSIFGVSTSVSVRGVARLRRRPHLSEETIRLVVPIFVLRVSRRVAISSVARGRTRIKRGVGSPVSPGYASHLVSLRSPRRLRSRALQSAGGVGLETSGSAAAPVESDSQPGPVRVLAVSDRSGAKRRVSSERVERSARFSAGVRSVWRALNRRLALS